MPGYKKRKLGNAGTTSDGGGADSGEDDHGTRQFADKLGFNDPGVPRSLYQVWRSCMQRAMSDFSIFGPGESGRTKFAELCEWGASHPAMAPKGQIYYHQQEYRSALNQLMQDVAKKARKSRQAMWEAIADARAAYEEDHPGVVIEPIGRLPDMGRPTAEPPYMPIHQGSEKARTESGAERLRAAARASRLLASPIPPSPSPVPPRAPEIPRLAVPRTPTGAPVRPSTAPARSAASTTLPAQPTPSAVTSAAPPRVPLAGAPPGVAGGPLASVLCNQPHPLGWAPAVGGPPITVRIHIITPEAHGPDPLYGGWIFNSTTISTTVVLGLHSMAAILTAAAPFIPRGRVIKYIYGMDVAGRFVHISMDYTLDAMIMAHAGPHLMDFQVELDPMGLVYTPSAPSTPAVDAHTPPVQRRPTPTTPSVLPRNRKARKCIVAGKTAGKGVTAGKGIAAGSVAAGKGAAGVTAGKSAAKGPTKAKAAKGTPPAKSNSAAKTSAAKGQPSKVVIPTLRRRAPTTSSSGGYEAYTSEDLPNSRIGRASDVANRPITRSVIPDSWRAMRGSGLPRSGESAAVPAFVETRRVRPGSRVVGALAVNEEVGDRGDEDGSDGDGFEGDEAEDDWE